MKSGTLFATILLRRFRRPQLLRVISDGGHGSQTDHSGWVNGIAFVVAGAAAFLLWKAPAAVTTQATRRALPISTSSSAAGKSRIRRLKGRSRRLHRVAGVRWNLRHSENPGRPRQHGWTTSWTFRSTYRAVTAAFLQRLDRAVVDLVAGRPPSGLDRHAGCGRFENGVGMFYADETMPGDRSGCDFWWTMLSRTDRAGNRPFPRAGANLGDNWFMDFTRTGVV